MKNEIYNLENVKSIDELFILVSEIGHENISEDDFKNINLFAKGYLLAEQNNDVNIFFLHLKIILHIILKKYHKKHLRKTLTHVILYMYQATGILFKRRWCKII